MWACLTLAIVVVAVENRCPARSGCQNPHHHHQTHRKSLRKLWSRAFSSAGSSPHLLACASSCFPYNVFPRSIESYEVLFVQHALQRPHVEQSDSAFDSSRPFAHSSAALATTEWVGVKSTSNGFTQVRAG